MKKKTGIMNKLSVECIKLNKKNIIIMIGKEAKTRRMSSVFKHSIFFFLTSENVFTFSSLSLFQMVTKMVIIRIGINKSGSLIQIENSPFTTVASSSKQEITRGLADIKISTITAGIMQIYAAALIIFLLALISSIFLFFLVL